MHDRVTAAVGVDLRGVCLLHRVKLSLSREKKAGGREGGRAGGGGGLSCALGVGFLAVDAFGAFGALMMVTMIKPPRKKLASLASLALPAF